jgi:hypothetical protein
MIYPGSYAAFLNSDFHCLHLTIAASVSRTMKVQLEEDLKIAAHRSEKGSINEGKQHSRTQGLSVAPEYERK